jgi:hypothetical protein
MLLVDVRTVPRSRANPQYSRDVLPESLAPSGIGYEHVASLGGWRGRARAERHSKTFRTWLDYLKDQLDCLIDQRAIAIEISLPLLGDWKRFRLMTARPRMARRGRQHADAQDSLSAPCRPRARTPGR